MKQYCATVQDQLGGGGVSALSTDTRAEEHIAECEVCYAFLEGLEHLDSIFKDLREEPVSSALASRVLDEVAICSMIPATGVRKRYKRLRSVRIAVVRHCNVAFERLSTLLVATKVAVRATHWKRNIAACTVAVLVLQFVIQGPLNRTAKRQVRIETLPSETYADLVLQFEKDIEAGASERSELRSELASLRQDHAQTKAKTAGIYETIVDKFEALGHEVDALAGALKQQSEALPENSKNLQGPDELESLGFDTPTVAPPPPEPSFENSMVDDSFMRDDAPVLSLPLLADDTALNPAPLSDRHTQTPGTSEPRDPAILRTLKEQLQEARRTTGPASAVIEMPHPRELRYYVTPGEPTQLVFPAEIIGGYKRKNSAVALERLGRNLIVFAQPEIPYEGEALLTYLNDGRSFAIRILPADEQHARLAIAHVDNNAANLDGVVVAEKQRARIEPQRTPSYTMVLPLNWEKTEDPLEWFTKRRSSVTDLNFKQPHGYWQNTYLPGSPMTRRLQTALLSWKAAESRQLPRLHEVASPPPQPFDAPHGAALGLFAHSDHMGLDAKGRLLLQVGLKGATIPPGSRHSLNVSVVLDVRGGLSSERLASLRKLLLTLNELRETGDRFEVLTAGTKESTLVAPANFLHGYVTIALDRLVQQAEAAYSKEQIIPLLDDAIHGLAPGENEASPYGGSLLLFVTDRPLQESTEQLEQLAYQSSAAGVRISVIGIGSGVQHNTLERIALAGQGSRWLLEGNEDMRPLLSKELTAAGRAIARAVRLNIRLAPGVQLVDVIGSQPLNELQRTAVTKVERSIDRRLAKSLGIEADRGEDEDGIQIIIPAFYAGDDHVILLDIVAPGPGKIAEVTARFKDLVYFRNGIARTELTIGSTAQAPGPLEENVLKNYLAFQLAAVLQFAGTGDSGNAIAALESYRRLLLAFRERFASFARDEGISSDLEMLDQYLQVLRQSANEALPTYLGNSLTLAGKRKLTPRINSLPADLASAK